ncbi:hypothetical protein AVDCRST_MAG94-4515 [uncultured Leptolyngbya sp.]|uniref:Uncharacterized protein n=1 Tax=uncultured Leptolyngbya sp. TaxID=332963 RepID=A0A6J4N5N9_9CYAN|nr:hypothetical protein AVDCRST_MAG94-4515 [uncultured Leptolyngbya sp.]
MRGVFGTCDPLFFPRNHTECKQQPEQHDKKAVYQHSHSMETTSFSVVRSVAIAFALSIL